MQDEPIPLGYCQCGCGERTPPYKQSDPKTGALKGEPSKYLHGHRRAVYPYEPRDCGYSTPCWVWLGATDQKGYGRVGGSRGGSTLAYRRLYEQRRGPVPAGLFLDHLCRNRSCVNPEHLEPVTNADNIRRGDRTKLTPDDVRAIRRSSAPQLAIADAYGIAPSHVHRIITRQAWADLPDA